MIFFCVLFSTPYSPRIQQKTTQDLLHLIDRFFPMHVLVVCIVVFEFFCQNCFLRVFDICVTFPMGIACNFYEVPQPHMNG